jgi:hypothetical protein
MEKKVSDAKDMPIGFPASSVSYNIVMNQDSTCTMSSLYWVSPFWGKSGYFYYSGDSSRVLDYNTGNILIWESEIRCVGDKWYFWYYSL